MFTTGQAASFYPLYGVIFALTLLAVVVLAILVSARMRQRASTGMPLSVNQRLRLGILAAALVLPLVFTGTLMVYLHPLGERIGALVGPTPAQAAAMDRSLTLNQQIVEEGAVLLENRHQALPLSPAQTPRLNLFGIASVFPHYSTSLGVADPEHNATMVTLTSGLEDAGFELNHQVIDFYRAHDPQQKERALSSFGEEKGEIYEVPLDEYGTLIDEAQTFSETAVIVISREGGEGGDLRQDMSDHGGDPGKHYLELQDSEVALLEEITDKFETVIVLINSANQVEAGFLENPDIDAAMWIGEPGDNGFAGIVALLTGEANPSGRLVDTWAYQVTSASSYRNFGSFIYLDEEGQEAGFDPAEKSMYASYVDYAEGIYLGYRYYETRWADMAGNVDEETYQRAVQYPFGYGLSYAHFSQKIVDYRVSGEDITLDVEVTNTGEWAGKEVVQIYFQPPYTPGGIEKSRVVLAGFAKTTRIEPGKSQTVTVSFPVESLASYDDRNHRAYVLEAGDYTISLQSDAHYLLDQRRHQVTETIVYDADNPRPSDHETAVNRFDDAARGNDIDYLSRANWEGDADEGKAAPKTASDERLADLAEVGLNHAPAARETSQSGTSSPEESADPPSPSVAGSDSDDLLMLDDLIGVPYQDPRWDEYAAQFSNEEMIELVSKGGWTTVEVARLGLPASDSADGPVGLNNYLTGEVGTGFASTMLMAATFNQPLIEEFGLVYGQEAAAFGYHGLYSPGLNLHRSPFGGRNFEYYSEDPLLSGKMAAATISGHAEAGIFAHAKHWAVNDQESNRQGVSTWLNEQSLRELYLRPFEIAVKEGGATSLMGSYNRIGTLWTAASRPLNVEVLRGEWGFRGHIITDYIISFYTYMNTDQALAGGVDLIETTDGQYPSEEFAASEVGEKSLRTATKNIAYTVANSGAMEYSRPEPFGWWPGLIVGAAILILGFIGMGMWTVLTPGREQRK